MGTRVNRTDYAWDALQLPTKNGAGFMRTEGYLTSSGVFPYEQEDGTTLREYRPAEEVADATSLDSLKLVPVTIGHPEDFVTIDNVKALGVGTVGDSIDVESEWPKDDKPGERKVRVRAKLMLTTPEAIKVVEDKVFREVSCGYSADLDMTPGITKDGEPYDAIQKRITYNHLAIGVVGRHGPGVALRVDHKPPTKTEPPVQKIILDGVTFEVTSQVAEAITAQQAKAAAKLKEAVDALESEKKKIAGVEARCDAATDAEKAAKKELAAIDAKVKERLKARRSLERAAASVMGDAFAELGDGIDDMDENALRVAVVKHVAPTRDLTGKSADYVAAAFDLAVESATVRTDSKGDDDETVRTDSQPKATGGGGLRADSRSGAKPADVVDAAEVAREERIARQRDAHAKRA